MDAGTVNPNDGTKLKPPITIETGDGKSKKPGITKAKDDGQRDQLKLGGGTVGDGDTFA